MYWSTYRYYCPVYAKDVKFCSQISNIYEFILNNTITSFVLVLYMCTYHKLRGLYISILKQTRILGMKYN